MNLFQRGCVLNDIFVGVGEYQEEGNVVIDLIEKNFLVEN